MDIFTWDPEEEIETAEDEVTGLPTEEVLSILGDVLGAIAILSFFIFMLTFGYSVITAVGGLMWNSDQTQPPSPPSSVTFTIISTMWNGVHAGVNTLHNFFLGPFWSLLRRDQAMAELSSNYWCGIFEPQLSPFVAQQRKVPVVLGGGAVVALLHWLGCPLHAAAVGVMGVILTGRHFPDFWATGNMAGNLHGLVPHPVPWGGQMHVLPGAPASYYA